jgi:hypothetical protein
MANKLRIYSEELKKSKRVEPDDILSDEELQRPANAWWEAVRAKTSLRSRYMGLSIVELYKLIFLSKEVKS